jgi:hypothetical protein
MPAHTAKFIVSAFNSQRFSGYQSFGNNVACTGQNSAIGLPGYFHQIGSGFLIQTFKIAQPDGFQLLDG